MHESYVYSGALEGFFDVTEGHLGVSPWLRDFYPFGVYHPNHPLLHLLGYVMIKGLQVFGWKLSALNAVVAINTMFGILGIVYFYRLLRLFTSEKIFATLMSCVLMFSDMYWFLSKSGEAYVSGQCFNILATYYIIKYSRERKLRYVLYQAICLGISMAFHSLFVFMLLPQFYIFYNIGDKKFNKNFFKIAGIVFVTILLFGVIFYILPLYFSIGARSFGQMTKVFLLYGEEMGVWTKPFSSIWKFLTQIVILPFFSGMLHFSYGILDGINPLNIFFRSLLILSFIWIFWKSFKNKSIENRYMLTWFWFYFLFTCYILFLPYDMTYWIFILPPFVFMLFLCLKDLSIRKFLPFTIVAILFLNNFFADILPKYLAKEETYFQVNHIADEVEDANQMAIVIFDSFAESSYLNYYGIIWTIKNNPKFANMKIEIIIDNNELDKKINKLSLSGEKFYVLKNITERATSLKELDDKLLMVNYKKTKASSFRYFYNPKLDKTSEFQHETNWYDLGPINQSWLMSLVLYEKNLTN